MGRQPLTQRIVYVGIHLDLMRQEYLEWLSESVGCKKNIAAILHSVDYYYSIPMDGNRYEDGIELRYKFGESNGYSHAECSDLDDRPCSVLEMMVAFSLRLSSSVFDNDDSDRAAHFIFENMLWYIRQNLRVSKIRIYDTMDGKQYWFPLKHATKNPNEIEVWYQGHEFLLENDI